MKTLFDLPGESLLKITSFINGSSILTLRLVNRHFNNILVNDYQTWNKQQVIIDFKFSDVIERINFIQMFKVQNIKILC